MTKIRKFFEKNLWTAGYVMLLFFSLLSMMIVIANGKNDVDRAEDQIDQLCETSAEISNRLNALTSTLSDDIPPPKDATESDVETLKETNAVRAEVRAIARQAFPVNDCRDGLPPPPITLTTTTVK